MEHYIRNEAEMSQDTPNHTKNKTRKLPAPHRTRLTPAAREEQIINVAAAHFARRGVVGASMLDIAKEAGITRALLYHYFPGKESLAAAVTRREARAVLETLSEHHEDPQDALHTALHVYFDRVAGRGTEATSDVPNTPDEYFEWMLHRTGTPVNDRTRMILGGWMHLVDYFARHVVQGKARGRVSAGARAMRTEEAIELCMGAADSLTGGGY